ncbi:ATP-binding protein [Marinoscillum sp.]|uniref:ATP-binding protein n=1 Tax=Marinoscillum sp. TaxID=2024838 RepID=UPI003BAAE6B0
MILKKIIPSLGTSAPIEVKLFDVILVLTTMVLYFWLVFWSVFSYFSRYESDFLLLYTAGSLIFTGFYFVRRNWPFYKWMTLLYYLLVYLLLGIAWLPAGGVTGSIHNMFVLIFLSGLLILRPKQFKMFIGISMTFVLGYTCFEILNPDSAKPFLDHTERMIDLAASNVLMLTILSFTLFFYKREYERDRERLKSSNILLSREKLRAESADRIKTTFLTNISHEIRTPLNGVLGNLDLLKRTDLSPEQALLLKDMSHCSDILHGLISDLLDMTMIEEEGMVLQEDRIDLHMVVSNVIQFFIPKVAMKKEKVSINYHADKRIPRYLKGDLTRVRQVLINLVNNAVKFTDEGEVNIRSMLLSKTSRQAEIKISISDTGMGIPEGQRANIFDKFHRNDTNTTLEGIGLGLSVCKKVVEAIGGEIGLEKQAGMGSSFYFILPFKIEGSKWVNQEEPELDTCRYSNLNVLVAEDQQVNQLVTRKMLGTLGISNVEIAENGKMVVEMAASKAYDFILMDIRMPMMSGIEATREILKSASAKPPVIVAVTANVTKHEMKDCFEAGMRDFISKPFSLEVLRSSFEKFLSKDKA